MSDLSSKQELRNRLKATYAAWSAEQIQAGSEAIRQQLLQIPFVQHAESIFSYLAVGHEVHTQSFLADCLAMGKTLLVPAIDSSSRMQLHRISSLNDCQPVPGRGTIPVPVRSHLFSQVPHVTLVPGLAFTTTGQRLGRGGGHYDRFLSQCPQTFSIALAFDEQVVPSLPIEPHDQRVRYLVTPTRFISCFPM